jgi:hypothetical protein
LSVPFSWLCSDYSPLITWINWQRNPRFVEQRLLIVTNQNHCLIFDIVNHVHWGEKL